MRVQVTGVWIHRLATCRRLIADGILVKNVDKLTYAANPKSLAAIAQHACYAFERAAAIAPQSIGSSRNGGFWALLARARSGRATGTCVIDDLMTPGLRTLAIRRYCFD
jgi:hypothetical protein